MAPFLLITKSSPPSGGSEKLFHEQFQLYFGLRAGRMLSVLSTNSLFALMTYAFEFSASVISHFDTAEIMSPAILLGSAFVSLDLWEPKI
jgi:hypothetical protein